MLLLLDAKIERHHLLWYVLVGILEYLHQLPGTQLVTHVKEGVSNPGFSGTPGSSDPMDVVFDRKREREVDDVLDSRNVQASCSNVGGHQDGHGAFLEVFHGFDSLLLKKRKRVQI